MMVPNYLERQWRRKVAPQPPGSYALGERSSTIQPARNIDMGFISPPGLLLYRYNFSKLSRVDLYLDDRSQHLSTKANNLGVKTTRNLLWKTLIYSLVCNLRPKIDDFSICAWEFSILP